MSIDRRSFVQSAAVAVGGAAGVAGDAAAQNRLQLAQAVMSFPTAKPAAAPTGPYKPNYSANIGDQTQRYYNFLKELFANNNLRDDIWTKSDAELRVLLKSKLGLDLTYYGEPQPSNSIRILIVDIGKGRVKFSDGGGCTVTGCQVEGVPAWYTLVLPPRPLEHTDPGYLDQMTWESAWHHAVVYGYGM